MYYVVYSYSTDLQTGPVDYQSSTHYYILYYLVIVGVQAVTILSKRVSKVTIQTQLRVDEEAWPPEPPKTFTPLVLIQHQGYHNLEQSTAMAKFIKRGHIDKLVTSDNVLPTLQHKLDNYEPLQEVLSTSKVTKEVAEILAPLETSNDP